MERIFISSVQKELTAERQALKHNPQRALPSAELRCMHFHGTEIARPVPFYQIFKGNLFKQPGVTSNKHFVSHFFEK